MARQFTRSRGRLGSRRESMWISLFETATGLAAASTAALFAGYTAAVLSLRPFTIIRTRGIFQINSDQQAVGELYHAGLAMSIVSDQALAIGVTAVPTPMTDRSSDLFFLYEELAGRVRFADATGITDQGIFTTFDSKAMRKVEEGQDIAVTIETSTISLGTEVVKAGRQLIKLH